MGACSTKQSLPLHACRTKHSARLALHLLGARLDAVDRERRTPLLHAYWRAAQLNEGDNPRFLELAEYLLRKGADPKTRDEDRMNCLHYCRTERAARLLTEVGLVDWSEIDEELTLTPLFRTVCSFGLVQELKASQTALIRYLIDNGAPLRRPPAHPAGPTPLHVCRDASLVEMLLDKDETLIDVRDEYGNNCLFAAVLRGNQVGEGLGLPSYLDFLRTLFERAGAPRLLGRNLLGDTLLHVCRQQYIAETLFSSSSRATELLEARNHQGETPLIHEVARDVSTEERASQLSYVQDLLRRGADVSAARMGDGNTPLHVCPTRELALVLLERGARLEALNGMGETPLLHVIRTGIRDGLWLELVRTLLEKGADPRAKDPMMEGGSSTLHLATPSVSIAKLLLARGVDLEVRNADGETPLFLAVKLLSIGDVQKARTQEMLNFIRYLLESGANPKTTNGLDERTPLHVCLHPGAAALLLQHGAELDARTRIGQTPLHHALLASQTGNHDVLVYVDYLLTRGANPELKGGDGETALHVCFRSSALDALIRHRPALSVDQRNAYGQTPLLVAVWRSSLLPSKRAHALMTAMNLIEGLLRRGADVDARAEDGSGPLHYCRHREIAELLVSHGATVNALDASRQTPLFHAVMSSQEYQLDLVEHVRYLCRSGADPCVQNVQGSTALHVCRHESLARVLIQHGAQLEVENEKRETPLLCAVPSSSPVTESEWAYVKYLLVEAGASARAQSKTSGATALHLCRDARLARLLLEKGAEASSRNAEGRTPLFLAVLETQDYCHFDRAPTKFEHIRFLILEAQASAQSPDCFGDTPLHVCGNREVAALLLDHGADLHARNKANQTPLLAVLERHRSRRNSDSLLRPLSSLESFHTMSLVHYLLERGADPNAASGRGTDKEHKTGEELLQSELWSLLPRFRSALTPTTPKRGEPAPLAPGKRFHFFAAHNWGNNGANHIHVEHLVRGLEDRGYHVWFDKNYLFSNIGAEITRGLNASEIFLCFLTKEYAKKIAESATQPGMDWCAYEFNHAMKLHGPSHMTGVVAEPAMLNISDWPEGIVQSTFSSKIYADYSALDKLSGSIEVIERQFWDLRAARGDALARRLPGEGMRGEKNSLNGSERTLRESERAPSARLSPAGPQDESTQR